jgi:hypothetical protein
MIDCQQNRLLLLDYISVLPENGINVTVFMQLEACAIREYAV